MYKYTRQEAAEKLNISTRSVDRYIRAGKLRSKKDGKIVYVKGSDVENLLSGGKKKVEVITPKKETHNFVKKEITNSTAISKDTPGMLDQVYSDLRNEVKKKDMIIQDLSMKLGRAEEITKNSISLMEYKKSQFLLEESKGYLTKEVEDLKETKIKLESDLSSEKKSNFLLLVFVVLLLMISVALWFINI